MIKAIIVQHEVLRYPSALHVPPGYVYCGMCLTLYLKPAEVRCLSLTVARKLLDGGNEATLDPHFVIPHEGLLWKWFLGGKLLVHATMQMTCQSMLCVVRV